MPLKQEKLNYTGMKKLILTICLLFVLSSSGFAQDTYYSVFSYEYFIPYVQINDNSISLQKALFPKDYKNRSVLEDMRWVQENDSALVDFWNSKGDTILHVLTELSGIEWIESEFDIYLLRYFPTIGSDDPMILPVGGINNGSFIEAAPDFDKLRLLLVYQLAKRMLLQAEKQVDSLAFPIKDHPLMRKSAYRFDNLAMLLAVTTSYTIMGVDTTYNVIKSRFWRNKFSGRKIFEEYFEKSWIITPDRPLAAWVTDEPVRSQLVRVTRTPQKKVAKATGEKKKFIENLPLKGQFGFSVKLNNSNRLAISKIDTYRLGFACGLRLGDVIRRIDGRMPRNHKQIVERLLEKLDDGGSVVEIVREGKALEIIIQPLEIDYYSDEYYFDEYNLDDTLFFDSTAIDTSQE